MKSQLLIPEKIKVGFVYRDDAYNGKLGFITYFDQNGVLRKEKSFQSWRDQSIHPFDYQNSPQSGFVLNKSAGGKENSWSSWNQRKTYIRVYDPRGFEIEISVPNLLFILQHYDCTKGKGLEGEFVYAWNYTELVLLPTQCQEYNQSIGFTKLQGKTVTAKELIAGAMYRTKKQECMIYLGKFKQNYFNVSKTDKHVFYSLDKKDYHFTVSLNFLAECIEEQYENFAFLLEDYINSKYNSPTKEILLVDASENDYLATEYQGHIYSIWGFGPEYRLGIKYTVANGKIDRKSMPYPQNLITIDKPQTAVAVLESGKRYKITH